MNLMKSYQHIQEIGRVEKYHKYMYLFMITTGKIYISLVLFLIYIDVYFSFALFHYW